MPPWVASADDIMLYLRAALKGMPGNIVVHNHEAGELRFSIVSLDGDVVKRGSVVPERDSDDVMCSVMNAVVDDYRYAVRDPIAIYARDGLITGGNPKRHKAYSREARRHRRRDTRVRLMGSAG